MVHTAPYKRCVWQRTMRTPWIPPSRADGGRCAYRDTQVLASKGLRTLARIKSPWSVLLKMRRKGYADVGEVEDIVGLRAVLRCVEIKVCSRAASIRAG